MRIHTNQITVHQIRAALGAETSAGRIADHVSFKTLSEHRSQSHAHAYEIQLEAEYRDNGRRAGNSGSYGAMRPEYDGYAATFDEWGWLLAALYAIDHNMVVGTAKNPVYRNLFDFTERTAMSYAPELLIAEIEEQGEDPFPYVTGQAARTKRGYLIGRRGANRVRGEDAWRWGAKDQPRTVTEVREFAHLAEVTS